MISEDLNLARQQWLTRYGDRIGLLGWIDVDFLCRNKPNDVFEIVLERGLKYRGVANGYALGSGNSIAGYVAVDGYLAMIEAAKQMREIENLTAGQCAEAGGVVSHGETSSVCR